MDSLMCIMHNIAKHQDPKRLVGFTQFPEVFTILQCAGEVMLTRREEHFLGRTTH